MTTIRKVDTPDPTTPTSSLSLVPFLAPHGGTVTVNAAVDRDDDAPALVRLVQDSAVLASAVITGPAGAAAVSLSFGADALGPICRFDPTLEVARAGPCCFNHPPDGGEPMKLTVRIRPSESVDPEDTCLDHDGDEYTALYDISEDWWLFENIGWCGGLYKLFMRCGDGGWLVCVAPQATAEPDWWEPSFVRCSPFELRTDYGWSWCCIAEFGFVVTRQQA